jgi:hypothetical protein
MNMNIPLHGNGTGILMMKKTMICTTSAHAKPRRLAGFASVPWRP